MVSNSKKAQAAIEFLMTYGWAIIAVLLTIAGLAYFGVVNPTGFVPDSCTMFSGIACVDMLANKDGMVMTLRNGGGKAFSSFSISVPGCQTASAAAGLLDGETEKIIFDCNFQNTKTIKTEIGLNYISDGVSHFREGSISAIVENNNNCLAPVCNSGFEKDSGINYGNGGDSVSGNNRADGWIYAGKATGRSGTAHSGSFSASYDNVDAVDVYPTVFRQELINVQTGNYQLKYWDKTDSTGRLTARITDSAGGILATTPSNALSVSWTERTLSFPVPSGTTQIRVYMWISGITGVPDGCDIILCNINVDDVSIEKV